MAFPRVACEYGAGSQSRFLGHHDAVDHGRIEAEKSAFADAAETADRRRGRQVGEVADLGAMGDLAKAANDDAFADPREGLDRGQVINEGPTAEGDRRIDKALRTDKTNELIPFLFGLSEKPLSRSVELRVRHRDERPEPPRGMGTPDLLEIDDRQALQTVPPDECL